MKVIFIKKRTLLIIPVIIVSLVLFFALRDEAVPTFYLPITNKVIAIDPGHGGLDPGALGSLGKHENHITLEIVLRLRTLIEQSGGVVILTRDIDESLHTEKSTTIRQKKNEDLRNRRILINESEPDVFLTIHLNSFPQPQYYGAHVFYKKGCDNSKKLSLLIQEEFRNILDKENKRVPQPRDSVYLVKQSESPSVLVEAGFLSNPNEERLLNESKYQEKIAWSIYIGLIRYFNEVENN